MADSTPLLRSPHVVSHAVTQDEIVLTHASHSSPVDAAPVANLFGFYCGGSQNKRVSAPRETLVTLP